MQHAPKVSGVSMELQIENGKTKLKATAAKSFSFSATATAMVLLLLSAAADHEGYSPYLLIVSATAIVAIWAKFVSGRRSEGASGV